MLRRKTMVKSNFYNTMQVTFGKGLGRAAFDSKGVASDDDEDGSPFEVSVLLIFWPEFG